MGENSFILDTTIMVKINAVINKRKGIRHSQEATAQVFLTVFLLVRCILDSAIFLL